MEYRLFVIPIIILIVNQIIKAIISAKKGGVKWTTIFSYGGMPSTHSAVVTSLSYVIGFYDGITRPAFAVALILSLIVIRDASGIRLQLGRHGQAINQLIKELPDEKEYKYPVMKEIFGHSHLEVTVGIISSLIFTSILIWFW
jgi:uncharacterized protein